MNHTRRICIFVFTLFCLSTLVHVFLDFHALSSGLYFITFFLFFLWCACLKMPPQLAGRRRQSTLTEARETSNKIHDFSVLSHPCIQSI